MSGNGQNEAAKINDYQKGRYEDYEKRTADALLSKYTGILDKIIQKKTGIKILDIGGGSGYFAMALYNYLSGNDFEITVVDTAEYNTWKKFSGKIKFMRESASNLEKVFLPDTFDIIFTNRVFHHFVMDSWEKTVVFINNIMGQISVILKSEGRFCITDYFYDGIFIDTSASRMIYILTSCKIPLLVKTFRHIEAKSAGVGVCFLSRKMWYRLINENNMYIEYENEGHKLKRSILRKIIYKICLFIKNMREDIVIVLRKQPK
jgi:SAM-dependent methyltransferase